MKKLLAILACVMCISTSAMADDDISITKEQLPKVSQEFINQHFSKLKVSYVKMERDLFDKSYDVIFVDGSKIEFRKDGSWKEVKCKYSSVPDNVVPVKIREYIKTNYPDVTIIKIEKDYRKYEITLSNGLEVDFNKAFQVIKVDY